MKHPGALFVLIVPAPGPGAETKGPPPGPLAITGVTVIDVAGGRSRPDQVAIVAGDRIKAVGKAGAVAIPDGDGVRHTESK